MQHKNLLDLPEDILNYLFTLFRPLDSLSASSSCKTLKRASEKSAAQQNFTEKHMLEQKLSAINQRINDKDVRLTMGGVKKIKRNDMTIHMPIYMNISKITKITYMDSEKIIFVAESNHEKVFCATSTSDFVSLAKDASDETKKRKKLSPVHFYLIEQEELQSTIASFKKLALFKSLYLDSLELLKESFVGFDDFKSVVTFEQNSKPKYLVLESKDIALTQRDLLNPILKRLKEAGVIDYEFRTDYLSISHKHKQSWELNIAITIKDFVRLSSACAELKPLADFINDFMRTFHTEFIHSCSNEEAEKTILELQKNGEIPFVYHFDANSKDWILSYLHQNEIQHKKMSDKVDACEILATLFENHQLTLQPMQIDKKMSI